MANPSIHTVFPVDGSTDLRSARNKYTINIDDADSSIKIDDTFVVEVYGNVSMDDINSVSDILRTNFNDTGPNPYKSTDVDLALSSGITLSVAEADGDFNNAIIFFDEQSSLEGCAVDFRIDFVATTTVSSNTPREYFPSTTFTGVSAGVCDYRTGSAVSLFFVGTNQIIVAGPSQDGVGTRVSSSPITYEWSNTTTYSIFMDYIQDKVIITANEAETDADTIIYNDSLSALGTCLSTVSIGGKAFDTVDNLILYIAQDGRSIGDTIIVENFNVYSKLTHFMYEGAMTPSARDSVVSTTDSIIGTDFSSWDKSNITESTLEAYSLIKFAKEPAGFLKKRMPGFSADRFCIVANLHLSLVDNYQEYTGIGINIRCSRDIRIRFFRDAIGFATYQVSSVGDRGQYSRIVDHSVVQNQTFMFILSGSLLYSYKINLGTTGVSTKDLIGVIPLNSFPLNSSGNYELEFTADAEYTATLNIKNLIISSHAALMCTPSGPNPTTPPTNIVSTNTSSYTTSTVTSRVYQGVPLTPFALPRITGVHSSIPKFSPKESGVTCIFRALIQEAFAPIPPKTEVGPFLLFGAGEPATANTLTHAVQLHIVRGLGDTRYVAFTSDSQSYLEVANQTNAGKAISFEVPKTFNILNRKAHFLSLCIKYSPRVGLYVYDLDNDMEVLLFIPWNQTGGIRRLLPNPNQEGVYLPTDIATDTHVTCATGVLSPPEAFIPIQMQVDLLTYAIGRGLDVEFYSNLDLDPIYGTKARLLITAGDND